MGHCIAGSQQSSLGEMEANHTCGAVWRNGTHTQLTIEVEMEVEMQDVMAEALEDAILDDGAIDIGSDDEYQYGCTSV